MRTVSGLHAQLIAPSFLAATARAYAAGKRHRPDVAWLLFRVEDVAEHLAGRLRDGS